MNSSVKKFLEKAVLNADLEGKTSAAEKKKTFEKSEKKIPHTGD